MSIDVLSNALFGRNFDEKLYKNAEKRKKVNMTFPIRWQSNYLTSYIWFYFTKQRLITSLQKQETNTRPGSAVDNESDYRCRSRKFYPGPVPYFHIGWSWHIISTAILLFPLVQEGCCQLQAKVCARSTG